MDRKRYNISLYFIVPIIFSGISVLSVLLCYRVIESALHHEIDKGFAISGLSFVLGFIFFLIGIMIVHILLKPASDFIKSAKRKLPNLEIINEKKSLVKQNELETYTQVFDQVSIILSKIDTDLYFPDVIGNSKAIRSLLGMILKVAPTESTVLLLGKSGTGKELIADSIFKRSRRKDKPFIKLNCVAIPYDLWESELFGHEKGAFTGAVSRKKGKFELADTGTLFLDEIGDMPLETQAKMLRVLQEKEFERVGGDYPVKVDVRIIAATNKNIDEMVEKGTFREDLFYRLNVFKLIIPPLNERKGDIQLLVENFLKQDHPSVSIDPMAMQMLIGYSWPGNVRELKNSIERAAVIADENVIKGIHLPSNLTGGMSRRLTDQVRDAMTLDEQIRKIEEGLIIEALRKTNGIQIQAADLLGINQRSLWHRIKKYNIEVSELKLQKV